MRKQNKAKALADKPQHNPVAKFAHHFNKAQVFADKRQYRRKAKHSGLEPFTIAYPIGYCERLQAVSCASHEYLGFQHQ